MSLLFVFSLTLMAFLLVIAGMAVGVMLGRRTIRGSCGGLGNSADNQTGLSCSLCSDPSAECRELGAGKQAARAASRDTASDENPQVAECERDCQTAGCSKEAIDACERR